MQAIEQVTQFRLIEHARPANAPEVEERINVAIATRDHLSIAFRGDETGRG
jgi:hypothetical protein